MEGSHPFSTGADLCLVHNGSLSNHFRLRQELKREGIHFETDNDTEVAAGYLTWRLQQGDSLKTRWTFAGRPGRLLHLRHRHAQRFCGDPRPDCLQAGDPRRDRRLRRHGLRISGAVEPAGHRERQDLGAGTGHHVHLGTRVSLRSAHMKTIDLSTATVRDLNQALHDQANNVEDREWVVTHSTASTTSRWA
jgi:hypothetical protein